MAAQTTYSFTTPEGLAGGLVDLSYHEVNTRMNEEADGRLFFGLGVMQGNNIGQAVRLPVDSSTVAEFEGVVLNSYNTEQDMKGITTLNNNVSVSVLRVGKVWVQISEKAEDVTYNNKLYLIIDGEETGYFTNKEAAGTDLAARLQIKGKFLGNQDSGIAPILLTYEMQE